MSATILTVLTVFAVMFFITAVYALWWAAKNGQFKKLEEGAKVIFDKDEPIGEQTDFFPSKKAKKSRKNKPSKNV